MAQGTTGTTRCIDRPEFIDRLDADQPPPGPVRISGGHLVVKALKSEGVEVIFTLCGGHIIDIHDGCVDEGIKMDDVRHEQVAAHAADGCARMEAKYGSDRGRVGNTLGDVPHDRFANDARRVRGRGSRSQGHRARPAAGSRIRAALANQGLGRPRRLRAGDHEPNDVQVARISRTAGGCRTQSSAYSPACSFKEEPWDKH